jgi:hypothetical protein
MRPIGDAAVSGVYGRLAVLGLVVDGYEVERRKLEVSSGFTRVTTTVVLHGGGHVGRGEDVSYAAEDHDGFPLDLPLAQPTGARGSLGAFCARLDDLAGVGEGRLFARSPLGPSVSTEYRRWGHRERRSRSRLAPAGVSLGCRPRPYARCASSFRRARHRAVAGVVSGPSSSSTRRRNGTLLHA